MDGTGRIAGNAIAEVFVKGMALIVGKSILLEGAALLGASVLKESHTTAAKVGKCVLAAVALCGAFVATTSLGFSAMIIIGAGIYTVSERLAGPLGCVLGASLALGTLPFHWKAFQWSGLVAQQNGKAV